MGYHVKINLKKLLRDNKISQKQLAEATGLRENTIGDIIRNTKTSMNLSHLEKIASALEISDIRKIISLEKD